MTPLEDRTPVSSLDVVDFSLGMHKRLVNIKTGLIVGQSDHLNGAYCRRNRAKREMELTTSYTPTQAYCQKSRANTMATNIPQNNDSIVTELPCLPPTLNPCYRRKHNHYPILLSGNKPAERSTSMPRGSCGNPINYDPHT